MLRVLALLSLLALLLWSCGPDGHRSCSGAAPAFEVVIKLTSRPLPQDTVVRVLYGGSAKEEFRLSDPKAPLEVTFCKVADETGMPIASASSDAASAAGAAGAADVTGEAGASGSGAPAVAPGLYCLLYTAGWTQLIISGSGFETRTYDLSPQGGDTCTVHRDLTPDDPDAGT